MKDITVKIKSYKDGAEQSYMYASGRLNKKKGNRYMIEFSDGELSSADKYFFEVENPSKVVMSASHGGSMSKFVFQEGVKHHCHYYENDDFVVLGVDAQQVRADIGDNGGELDVRYIVDYNNAESSTNRMHIRVDVKDKGKNILAN